MRLCVLLVCVGLSACQVTLPEGRILCGPEENECPEGWRCDGDLCVQGEEERDAGSDAQPSDGEPDVFDSGPPPQDAETDAVLGDTGQDVPPGPDAGFDPPTNVALISSNAALTIDAIDVKGTSIYVAGAVAEGDAVHFGLESISGVGLWVARYTYIPETQTLTFDWVADVPGTAEVTSLAVLGERVVVGGSFTSLFGTNLMVRQGFLFDISVNGGATTLLGTFGTTGGAASVDAIDAEGDSLCAVGEASRGSSNGTFNITDDVDNTRAGFTACFNETVSPLTQTSPAASIATNPPRDVVLRTSAEGFAAVLREGDDEEPGDGGVFTLSVAESALRGDYTFWPVSFDALFVDYMASAGPVLLGPSAEGHTVAVGLMLNDSGAAFDPAWVRPLQSEGGTVTPTGLAVIGEEVHVVGHQIDADPTPPRVPRPDGGFHATFRYGSKLPTIISGARSINVVAGLGNDVVLGGRFIEHTSYPVPLQSGADNTLFLVVQSSEP